MVILGFAKVSFYLRVSPKLLAQVRKNYLYKVGDSIAIKYIEKGWGSTGDGWVPLLWISMDAITVDPPPPPPVNTDITRPMLPPFITPSGGKIIQFTNDNWQERWDYKSRVVKIKYKGGALPSTIPLNVKPDFAPLSRDWQELAFQLIIWQDNGRNTHDAHIEMWKSIMMDHRALTDRNAWDTPNEMGSGYHDYILGTNVNARDVAQKRLGMSGNIAHYLGGGKVVVYAALATNQPCPKIEDIWGDHTKIWWATESNRPDWLNGGKIDETGRWPQLGSYGVPYLNISPNGLNKVSRSYIVPIGNNIPFSPYTI